MSELFRYRAEVFNSQKVIERSEAYYEIYGIYALNVTDMT